MIRSIIIDDELNCIESLQYDLQKFCPEIEVIQTCLSPKDGLLAIRQQKPDLIFLDIQMPWMNGFEMLSVIGEIDFAIIFTTAFDQFAAKAFRISAIDFLLKPIDVNDLKQAVQKAGENIRHKTGNANIDNLLNNIRKPAARQRIAFSGKDGYEFVEISSIVYAQAEGAYTHVMLNDERKLVISRTLSDIEDILPADSFLRIHHSTLINLNRVTHFLRNDGSYIVLDNGSKLIVSKSKKELVMQRLGLK